MGKITRKPVRDQILIMIGAPMPKLNAMQRQNLLNSIAKLPIYDMRTPVSGSQLNEPPGHLAGK